MKVKITFIFFLFTIKTLLTPLLAQVQERGIITGKVIDANSRIPLEYATISIFTENDSILMDGIMVGKEGIFSLKIFTGHYYITCDYLGYESKIISDLYLTEKESTLDLGNILLFSIAQTLSEVEVRADKSFLEMTLDKRVFNVGKDLASTGGSAADILNNVPSVTVDEEGQISLRGSQGVQILVDGKPSGLVARGGLQNLSADIIEKVEIITNPSAKFDAEGTAGIINIILKKKREKGLNGTFNNTVGYVEALASAVNLNYRKKQLNLFTNISLSRWRNIGNGAIYREVYFDSDSTNISTSKRDHTLKGRLGSFRIGTEYFINPNNTLTFSVLQRKVKGDNEVVLNFSDFWNNLETKIGGSTRTKNEETTDKNQELALTYKKRFGKKDHDLIADLRLQNSQDIDQANFLESYFVNGSASFLLPDLEQLTNSNETSFLWNIKIDYQIPLNEDEKFEAGIQSRYREFSNKYVVKQLHNDKWEVFEELDNEYQYHERIQAAYAMYSNKINRITYQLGTRLEYAKISTSSPSLSSRKRLDLFPSAHFTFNLSSLNAFQLSYSRRVTRPRFRSLNPFPSFTNSRSRFQGNPELRPEYTGMYELGYLRYWEKGSLGTSLFFRHTRDVIEGVIFQVLLSNPHPINYRRPENLLVKNDLGFELNFSISHPTWLKINGNAYFYRAIIKGEAIQPSYSSDTYTARGKLTSRFTIAKKLDAQIRINYRAPFDRPQGRRYSFTFLDFVISQKLFQNKGTLTLNISDVFNSRKTRGIDFTDTFFQEDEYQWRERTIKLTLYYRLGK